MVWFNNGTEHAGKCSGSERRVSFVQAFAVAVCGLCIRNRSRYRCCTLLVRQSAQGAGGCMQIGQVKCPHSKNDDVLRRTSTVAGGDLSDRDFATCRQ